MLRVRVTSSFHSSCQVDHRITWNFRFKSRLTRNLNFQVGTFQVRRVTQLCDPAGPAHACVVRVKCTLSHSGRCRSLSGCQAGTVRHSGFKWSTVGPASGRNEIRLLSHWPWQASWQVTVPPASHRGTRRSQGPGLPKFESLSPLVAQGPPRPAHVTPGLISQTGLTH